jgi:hypothetical protein
MSAPTALTALTQNAGCTAYGDVRPQCRSSCRAPRVDTLHRSGAGSLARVAPRAASTNTVRRIERITGRTYLERGQPVVEFVRWSENPSAPGLLGFIETVSEVTSGPKRAQRRMGRTGPRNVPIRRIDGTRVVRHFRDLRRETIR